MKKILLITIIFTLMTTIINAKKTVKEITYDLNNISELVISSFSSVTIEYSDKNELIIEVDADKSTYVKVKAQASEIKASFNFASTNKNKVYTSKVTIKTNQMERLVLNKVGKVMSDNTYLTNILGIKLNAVAEALLQVETNKLIVDAQSVAKLKITGQTQETNLKINSISLMDSESLKSDILIVNANGCSSLNLFAEKELRISANGIASLSYKGNFKIIEEKLSGIGRVQRN